jgi:hypothetical protein
VKAINGTKVFGWCMFPMSDAQHKLCKLTNINADGTTRTCECPCHKEKTNE